MELYLHVQCTFYCLRALFYVHVHCTCILYQVLQRSEKEYLMHLLRYALKLVALFSKRPFPFATPPTCTCTYGLVIHPIVLHTTRLGLGTLCTRDVHVHVWLEMNYLNVHTCIHILLSLSTSCSF